MWDKLNYDEFTTWRFPRKDAPKGRDWHIGEKVQCYYKNRSPKNRKYLFNAEIISKEPRRILLNGCINIGIYEAKADGFIDDKAMFKFFVKEHGRTKVELDEINKFTLRKI
jgi:hypothetical protein